MNAQRILIIEDDDAFVGYLRTCLIGAEIVVVQSLREAMNQLEAMKFDLIICDLRLPDWGGKPDVMLTLIGMRAKGAAIGAITGRVSELPRNCDAAEFKVNLSNIDTVLDFVRRAQSHARRHTPVKRQIDALCEFVHAVPQVA